MAFNKEPNTTTTKRYEYFTIITNKCSKNKINCGSLGSNTIRPKMSPKWQSDHAFLYMLSTSEFSQFYSLYATPKYVYRYL